MKEASDECHDEFIYTCIITTSGTKSFKAHSKKEYCGKRLCSNDWIARQTKLAYIFNLLALTLHNSCAYFIPTQKKACT